MDDITGLYCTGSKGTCFDFGMVMSLVCVSACVSNESYFSSSSKMGGLRGIYVASQLKENATVKRIAPEDLQTVISFDKVGPHFFSTFFIFTINWPSPLVGSHQSDGVDCHPESRSRPVIDSFHSIPPQPLKVFDVVRIVRRVLRYQTTLGPPESVP